MTITLLTPEKKKRLNALLKRVYEEEGYSLSWQGMKEKGYVRSLKAWES